MEKQRNTTIDTIKGLGILLVVIGHVSHHYYLSGWIYTFHMPLFFFISGVLYTYGNREDFCFRKFKSLLIPYFSFAFASLAYWALLEAKLRGISVDKQMVWEQFSGIFIAKIIPDAYLFNIVLWFLPCLFVVEMFLFVSCKMLRNKKILWGG